ncbi:MAG: domain containing protein [Chloroflexi bacterium]|nr:domain containing protein [Chloroflexota bacterium]
MRKIFPITSVGGIAIRAHVSAVVAFAILLLLLASVYLPALLPSQQMQTYWSLAFISTLSLFLSTLARELGRCLMARKRGLAVQSISFVVFGCVSDIRREHERAVDEALVSIAAPVVSLILAAATGVAHFLIPDQQPEREPLKLFLSSVFILNLWIGTFNLLPALPLDGGRAVRGFLWRLTGSFNRATRLTSVIGRLVAAVFFLAGLGLVIVSLDEAHQLVPTLLGYDPRIVGVAAVFLAWFINGGARNAQRQMALQGRFEGVTVANVMTVEPPAVPAWTSIGDMVASYFVQRGERAVAVVRDSDVLLGIVAYSDVRRVPRSEWGTHGAGEVMTPLRDLVTVAPEDEVDVAVRHMAEKHLNQLPVVKDGRLVGMVARVNILRFIGAKDEEDKNKEDNEDEVKV